MFFSSGVVKRSFLYWTANNVEELTVFNIVFQSISCLKLTMTLEKGWLWSLSPNYLFFLLKSKSLEASKIFTCREHICLKHHLKLLRIDIFLLLLFPYTCYWNCEHCCTQRVQHLQYVYKWFYFFLNWRLHLPLQLRRSCL